MSGDKFDGLIRAGRDIEALRLFAKEYYESGKMGYTRKCLIDRCADTLEQKEDELDIYNSPRLVDELGRITIPKIVRNLLKIRDGDVVGMRADLVRGEITIKAIKEHEEKENDNE